MKLIKGRIQGFQSFRDTGEIEFAEGISLIIGQNNSGKSALLRALLPELPDDRHRAPENWETFKLREPEVLLTLEASGAEIRDWVLRSGAPQSFPSANRGAVDFMDEFFSRPSLRISIGRKPNSTFSGPYPSHRLFDYAPGEQQACAVATPNNGELTIQPVNNSGDSLPGLFWTAWQREMFYFAAERMTIGEAPSGHADRLRPNASNLPNVLHTLSSERGDVFRQLVHHLQEIFSTVGNLSVRTAPSGPLEVRVWPTEAMERVELSFPLNSSGTGVAQIIALLTAIMTIDKAVFVIDEINSFLHPAAVKALLRILQTQYTQHQYIISTHAPDVIGFGNRR
jgi:hypothetical protein